MNNKGLTLIELLAFFLICAIVFALAAPSFRIISDMHLKGDARSLVNDIRHIKELAIIEGVEHKIIFESDGYSIVDNSSNIIKSYKFNKGIILSDYQLNSGPNKVNFMSYNLKGNARASGSLSICKADGSKAMTITIVPVTGRALLEQ